MQNDHCKVEENFNVDIYQDFQLPSIALVSEVVPRLNARN